MARKFNVLTPGTAIFNGAHRLAADQPDALGLLVKLDAAGKLVPTSASTDQAFGFVIPVNRWVKYRQADNSASADEFVTVAQGHFVAHLNADCYNGTPDEGMYVVPDAGGKVTFVASRPAYYIGVVAGFDSLRAEPGFGTADEQLVRVVFSI